MVLPAPQKPTEQQKKEMAKKVLPNLLLNKLQSKSSTTVTSTTTSKITTTAPKATITSKKSTSVPSTILPPIIQKVVTSQQQAGGTPSTAPVKTTQPTTPSAPPIVTKTTPPPVVLQTNPLTGKPDLIYSITHPVQPSKVVEPVIPVKPTTTTKKTQQGPVITTTDGKVLPPLPPALTRLGFGPGGKPPSPPSAVPTYTPEQIDKATKQNQDLSNQIKTLRDEYIKTGDRETLGALTDSVMKYNKNADILGTSYYTFPSGAQSFMAEIKEGRTAGQNIRESMKEGMRSATLGTVVSERSDYWDTAGALGISHFDWEDMGKSRDDLINSRNTIVNSDASTQWTFDGKTYISRDEALKRIDENIANFKYDIKYNDGTIKTFIPGVDNFGDMINVVTSTTQEKNYNTLTNPNVVPKDKDGNIIVDINEYNKLAKKFSKGDISYSDFQKDVSLLSFEYSDVGNFMKNNSDKKTYNAVIVPAFFKSLDGDTKSFEDVSINFYDSLSQDKKAQYNLMVWKNNPPENALDIQGIPGADTYVKSNEKKYMDVFEQMYQQGDNAIKNIVTEYKSRLITAEHKEHDITIIPGLIGYAPLSATTAAMERAYPPTEEGQKNVRYEAYKELLYTPPKELEWKMVTEVYGPVASFAASVPKMFMGVVTFPLWAVEELGGRLITGQDWKGAFTGEGQGIRLPVPGLDLVRDAQKWVGETFSFATPGLIEATQAQAIYGMTHQRPGAPTFEVWKQQKEQEYQKWHQIYSQGKAGGTTAPYQPNNTDADWVVYSWEWGDKSPEWKHAEKDLGGVIGGTIGEIFGAYLATGGLAKGKTYYAKLKKGVTTGDWGKTFPSLAKIGVKETTRFGFVPVAKYLIKKSPEVYSKVKTFAKTTTPITSSIAKYIQPITSPVSRMITGKAGKVIKYETKYPSYFTRYENFLAKTRSGQYVKDMQEKALRWAKGNESLEFGLGQWKPKTLIKRAYDRTLGRPEWFEKTWVKPEILTEKEQLPMVKSEKELIAHTIESEKKGAYLHATHGTAWSKYALADTLENMLNKIKYDDKPISHIFNLKDPLQKIAIDYGKQNHNFIFTGSKAMMLQVQSGIDSLVPYLMRLKGIAKKDIDFIYKGSIEETRVATEQFAKYIENKLGGKVSVGKGAHEGTFHIYKDGNRIFDVTSYESWQRGAMGRTPPPNIRNIEGISVADLTYLLPRKTEIINLVNIIPKETALKAITDYRIMGGPKIKYIEEGPKIITQDVLRPYITEGGEISTMHLQPEGGFISTRLGLWPKKTTTPYGARLGIHGTHVTPLAAGFSKWFWRLQKGEEYKPSFLPKVGGRPSGIVFGTKTGKFITESEIYRVAEKQFNYKGTLEKMPIDIRQNVIDFLITKYGGTRSFTPKELSRLRNLGQAEEELAIQADIERSAGIVRSARPEIYTGKWIEKYPRYGRWSNYWEKKTGVAGTILTKEGDVIPIRQYQSVPIKKGAFKEKRSLLKDERSMLAEQPIAPKVEIKPKNLWKEIERYERELGYKRGPATVSYRLLKPYKYKPEDYYSSSYKTTREYVGYEKERPTGYRPTSEEYTPRYTPTRGEYYDGYPYPYEPTYPYEGYPYQGYGYPAMPSRVGLKYPFGKEEEKKKETPKIPKWAMHLGYKERTWEVPDIWGAVKTKPMWAREQKPVSKKPEFFNLIKGGKK